MNIVVRILERRKFTFDLRSGSGDTTIPLTGAIDTSDVVSGQLQVRLHSKSWSSGPVVASLELRNFLPSRDQPDVDFEELPAVASVNIASGDAAPKLMRG